jgi:DNA mismatch endonuclease (patch repair protein)
MVDVLTKEKRSWNMGQVRDKNTKPELIVRSLLHRHGFRFRLHKKKLPGKPDIVLFKYRTIVFVHGCFWHRHENCSDATVPKTRTEFWTQKFSENVKRDTENHAALRKLGWNVLIVWECETANQDKLIDRLKCEINSSNNKAFH